MCTKIFSFFLFHFLFSEIHYFCTQVVFALFLYFLIRLKLNFYKKWDNNLIFQKIMLRKKSKAFQQLQIDWWFLHRDMPKIPLRTTCYFTTKRHEFWDEKRILPKFINFFNPFSHPCTLKIRWDCANQTTFSPLSQIFSHLLFV